MSVAIRSPDTDTSPAAAVIVTFVPSSVPPDTLTAVPLVPSVPFNVRVPAVVILLLLVDMVLLDRNKSPVTSTAVPSMEIEFGAVTVNVLTERDLPVEPESPIVTSSAYSETTPLFTAFSSADALTAISPLALMVPLSALTLTAAVSPPIAVKEDAFFNSTVLPVPAVKAMVLASMLPEAVTFPTVAVTVMPSAFRLPSAVISPLSAVTAIVFAPFLAFKTEPLSKVALPSVAVKSIVFALTVPITLMDLPLRSNPVSPVTSN